MTVTQKVLGEFTTLCKADVRTYDVWGNKDEGYEVNDVRPYGIHEVRAEIELMGQFAEDGDIINIYTHWDIPDGVIRLMFDLPEGEEITCDGNESMFYVELADGYPVGQVEIISPELSHWVNLSIEE